MRCERDTVTLSNVSAAQCPKVALLQRLQNVIFFPTILFSSFIMVFCTYSSTMALVFKLSLNQPRESVGKLADNGSYLRVNDEHLTGRHGGDSLVIRSVQEHLRRTHCTPEVNRRTHQYSIVNNQSI